MNLTEQEKQMIMEQRVMESREQSVYAEPTGYERGGSMLGQVLQHALNEAMDSSNEAVAEGARRTAESISDTYESWDKVVADTAYVNRIKGFIKDASTQDEGLVNSYELIDSGMKDMKLSDKDFELMDEASRNNMKEPDEWSRKTSNTDGNIYVVNNATGEYYSEEEWESNNTQEVQAHTLGWQGEEGVEHTSFNASLPSK